jgi:hypothetical protein
MLDNNKYQKEYRNRIRDRVFAILGDKCIFCGETDPIVLAIDHIVACGREGRKQTVLIYLEILKAPEKARLQYQLLCRNCNWRKAIRNNERTLQNTDFAYHWEVHQLASQVEKLRNRIDAIQSSLHTTNKHPTPTTNLSEGNTDAQLAQMIYSYKNELLDQNGKLNQRLLRIVFQRKLNITVGHNKAYTIVSMLKYDHPNEFP